MSDVSELFALSVLADAPGALIEAGSEGARQGAGAIPPAWVAYVIYEDFPADDFGIPEELAWDAPTTHTDYLFVPWPKDASTDPDRMIPFPEGAPNPGLEFIPLPSADFLGSNSPGYSTEIYPLFHTPSEVVFPILFPAFFHPEGAFFLIVSPDTDPPAPPPAWAGNLGDGWAESEEGGGAPTTEEPAPVLTMMQIGEAWNATLQVSSSGGWSEWSVA